MVAYRQAGSLSHDTHAKVRALGSASLGSNCWLTAVLVLLVSCGGSAWAEQPLSDFIARYCADCHTGGDPPGQIAFDSLDWQAIDQHSAVLERGLRQLNARHMPPLDAQRPNEAEYAAATTQLATVLDEAAAAHPNPGRTDTLRRLSRTEYGNAIRDLLALEIDATHLLPADEASHGFDNVTVGELSPMLLSRYVAAAQKISRLAIGGELPTPAGDTFRVKPDVTQEEHVEGLPLGTRGGVLLSYTFPRTGEYQIDIRLARDRNEEVEGLRGTHQLLVLIDRKQIGTFSVRPPENQDHSQVDAHLKQRFTIDAGPHDLGVTFLKKSAALIETMRQPYDAHFNMHRHPRLSPAVYQVSLTGPYTSAGAGDTPSRRQVFVRYPTQPAEELACARLCIASLAQRAFRRPVTAEDLAGPMEFYQQARAASQDFEAGIGAALSSILVSPNFLFRIERDPPQAELGQAYPISDIDLASRLSFFLWSSLPDQELLELAISQQLRQPEILEQQTRRMLADERASSLVTNFAAQWLYLRNLDSITPDMRLFPDFDDNLRQALRTETELFFASVMRDDRSVLDLLRSDSTYLNERLARHYGIPHIYGSHFRRVELDSAAQRGGLLRQGSILTVTSYATRTSPVIRGHWILKNFLGTTPPPPPPNVPALEDNTVSAGLPVRERLAAHRANPACASCHDLMDPVGFSLENFDAVGRWRTMEAGQLVESLGGLPDGSQFAGVAGLEQALLSRPELFVGTLTEKLLTFALGRGVEPYDAPAIRKIVRDSRLADYRFSALIVGIVSSQPFQMRRAE